MTDLAWMRPKLAKLCDVSLTASGDIDDYESDLSGVRIWWRPDEDVAHAVRCLEASFGDASRTAFKLEKEDLWPTGYRWKVFIFRKSVNGSETISLCMWAATIPRAICLAIAAALGWTDTNSGTETEHE